MITQAQTHSSIRKKNDLSAFGGRTSRILNRRHKNYPCSTLDIVKYSLGIHFTDTNPKSIR